MSQADYVIADQSAPNVRAEMNTIFAAIVSQNSGATEPSTKFAYMWWYDTSTNILKMRNSGNDAWIEFATFDQTNDTWYLTKLRVGTGVMPVGSVGIAIEGSHGTDSSSAGPHKQFTTDSDNYPLYQLMNWAHDNISQGYDCYFDGSNWKSSDVGSNFRVSKIGDEFIIYSANGVTIGNNISWTEAFKISNAGAITISNATSISFGNEALTTYDEGTFTPIITAATTPPDSVTYGSQLGRYIKIGKIVQFQIEINLSGFTLGSGAGQLQIGSLPFTSANSAINFQIVSAYFDIINLDADTIGISGGVNANTTVIAIYQYKDNTGGSSVGISGIGSTTNIWISGTYESAS